MASDTRSDEAPRRKTLEDIRREIEAEYALPPEADEIPVQQTRETAGDQGEGSHRPGTWRSYLTAALIGCVTGQALILAYFVAALYARDARAPRSVASPPVRGAPPSLQPNASIRLEAPTAPTAEVAADAARADGAPDTVTSAAPPASSHPGLDDDRSAREAGPRVVVRQPPSVTPPAPPRRPLVGPDNWVESQAQVRSALAEWLAIWSSGDVERQVSEAEVILGADGWTAKTRVPIMTGAGGVMREQHWERSVDGWKVVENRDLGRAPR
jgi:hypothetical protein